MVVLGGVVVDVVVVDGSVLVVVDDTEMSSARESWENSQISCRRFSEILLSKLFSERGISITPRNRNCRN